MYLSEYIHSVLQRGELYLEIERIRSLMVGAHRYPGTDKAEHRERIHKLTEIFHALLAVRDARLSLGTPPGSC